MRKLHPNLHYTFRLQEHIRTVMNAHFELRDYQQEDINIEDIETYRAYIRDFITTVENTHLTPEQQYLQSLLAITEPSMSAFRFIKKIRRLKPRTGRLNASRTLEETAKLLAMESYHFKERIRLFSKNTSTLMTDASCADALSIKIKRLLQKYERTNKKLIKYRNYVVHGPRGRLDEFASLRTAEICAHTLHDDLWFDYKNEFEIAQDEWMQIGKSLIDSMETATAEIQLINENAISCQSLTFCAGEFKAKLVNER